MICSKKELSCRYGVGVLFIHCGKTVDRPANNFGLRNFDGYFGRTKALPYEDGGNFSQSPLAARWAKIYHNPVGEGLAPPVNPNNFGF